MIDGTPNWNGKWNKQWYGVKRFFEYLEIKAYKMHIRVLLVEVPQLHAVPGLRRRAAEARGAAVAPRHARKTPTRCWRRRKRFMPVGVQWSREQLEALPGLTVHDLMLLPIDRIRALLRSLCRCRATLLDEALKLLLDEIRTRLQYLVRRRHRLPHARPPEPHALGRRGAAHQPDDRARHLAGQHAVRARRAVASACTRAT